MELLILLAVILVAAWFVIKVLFVYTVACLVFLGLLSVKDKLDL
jgi:hypothetical protein